MAESIVPTNSFFDLATGIANEANSMGIAVRLANSSLQFQFADVEQVRNAQDELFFLLDALAAVQKRLDALSASAYALSRIEMEAAA